MAKDKARRKKCKKKHKRSRSKRGFSETREMPRLKPQVYKDDDAANPTNSNAKKKKKSKHKHKSHKHREMPRLKRQVYHDDERNPDRPECESTEDICSASDSTTRTDDEQTSK